MKQSNTDTIPRDKKNYVMTWPQTNKQTNPIANITSNQQTDKWISKHNSPQQTDKPYCKQNHLGGYFL